MISSGDVLALAALAGIALVLMVVYWIVRPGAIEAAKWRMEKMADRHRRELLQRDQKLEDAQDAWKSAVSRNEGLLESLRFMESLAQKQRDEIAAAERFRLAIHWIEHAIRSEDGPCNVRVRFWRGRRGTLLMTAWDVKNADAYFSVAGDLLTCALIGMRRVRFYDEETAVIEPAVYIDAEGGAA